MVHLKTLVLNNNYMPLSVFPLYTIPAEDAISRVLNGNADSVFNYSRPILTPSRDDLFWPSVIVNRNGFKYRDEVKLKRETLYYRDHGRCMYCGGDITIPTLSIDHVIPRSKNGKHSWTNVVASCRDCNQEKKDEMPLGKWKPKQAPYKPSFFQLLELRKQYPIVVHDMNWMEFLPKWGGDVVVREPFMCEAV
jgi:hypothetical protein